MINLVTSHALLITENELVACYDRWVLTDDTCASGEANLLSPGCRPGHGARGQIWLARSLAYGSVARNLSCVAHDRVRVKS